MSGPRCRYRAWVANQAIVGISTEQLNVHQDDVRATGPDLGGGLGPVTSLADDREPLRL
jgi:hypothetical protein